MIENENNYGDNDDDFSRSQDSPFNPMECIEVDGEHQCSMNMLNF